MKNFLIITLLLINNILFAQFAKILDKDGYVNLRKEPNSKSKILIKIKSNEIVFISNKNNDNDSWSYISYMQENGKKTSYGFIHNSKLKSINTFLEIPSVESNQLGTKFLCCNIDVTIKSRKIDYANEKKFFKKHDAYISYKGKYAFGTAGIFPPKTQYLSVNGIVESKAFNIPINEIDNFFDINNDETECYYDKDNKILYIIFNNSDGSSTYNVILIIENGIYKKRSIYDDY